MVNTTAGDLLNSTIFDLAIAATNWRACIGRRHGAGACPTKCVTYGARRLDTVRQCKVLPLDCRTLHSWSR